MSEKGYNQNSQRGRAVTSLVALLIN